jgi:V/A-type H+/Na+-transporting ATPase subunit D
VCQGKLLCVDGVEMEITGYLEQIAVGMLRRAFEALNDAQLDTGSESLDQASLAVSMDHQVKLSDQHLMGMKIPRVKVRTEKIGVQFRVSGTSLNADITMARFVEVLPLLAELENAVMRLALELRKTQRRCNALSKIFMPNYRESISYITGALEEKERESFVILKMIRDRLA